MSNFPGVDFLGTTLKFWKGKKNSLLLVYYVLHKRWIRDFHAVVVQWRQKGAQKSVLYVQSYCFANQTYCFFFWSSRFRRRRRC